MIGSPAAEGDDYPGAGTESEERPKEGRKIGKPNRMAAAAMALSMR